MPSPYSTRTKTGSCISHMGPWVPEILPDSEESGTQLSRAGYPPGRNGSSEPSSRLHPRGGATGGRKSGREMQFGIWECLRETSSEISSEGHDSQLLRRECAHDANCNLLTSHQPESQPPTVSFMSCRNPNNFTEKSFLF